MQAGLSHLGRETNLGEGKLNSKSGRLARPPSPKKIAIKTASNSDLVRLLLYGSHEVYRL